MESGATRPLYYGGSSGLAVRVGNQTQKATRRARILPVHAWTRVTAGTFHDFHNAWIAELRHALNGGVLPAGHEACSFMEYPINTFSLPARLPYTGSTHLPLA